jgi:glyoxylase-like metal-dependent hydrolase (beta-lactamase superfamily II)
MTQLSQMERAQTKELADGVWYLGGVMSNMYFVGRPRESWVLIDTGSPGKADRVRAATKEIYGERKPEAIILTHGHFDHAGSVQALSDHWDVPVFAHRLELPFLDGRENYPPMDPTVGGFTAQLSRMFPCRGIDLGERLHPLPEDGSAPFLPGWRCVHTPGHTSGHVSLFRDNDRTLLAGDAVITINQQNPFKLALHLQEFCGPPLYATTNWDDAMESIRRLADLRPVSIGAGHGLPMSGPEIPARLAKFASSHRPPEHGRYVGTPALADERGVYFVPPKPPDHAPMYAAGVALAAAGLLAFRVRHKGREEAGYPKGVPGRLLRPGD